jgi:hypothetical protein
MYKLLAGNPEQEAVSAAAMHRPRSYITIMLDNGEKAPINYM